MYLHIDYMWEGGLQHIYHLRRISLNIVRINYGTTQWTHFVVHSHTKTTSVSAQ